MKTVIHIGADSGEIEFYEDIDCKNLTYVEPDKGSLIKLKENASRHFKIESRSLQKLKIIPKACSSESGRILKFYANSNGQSSLEKPGQRTKDMIGEEKAQFQEYEVETTTLQEIHKESVKDSNHIDYLCIDTQGHEKSIICPTPPKFLSDTFSIIDIELMTDTGQYGINPNNWKEVVSHLIGSGFTPLIHPHGITESYVFLNSKHNNWIDNVAIPIAGSIARKLSKQLFKLDVLTESAAHTYANISSLGDHSFLPLGITGGSVHMSQLQQFREEFIRRAALITPAQYELITS